MKLIIREKAKKLFLIAVICALLLTALGSGGYLIFRHTMLPARQQNDIRQLKELISQSQVVVSEVSEPSKNPLESLQKVNSEQLINRKSARRIPEPLGDELQI